MKVQARFTSRARRATALAAVGLTALVALPSAANAASVTVRVEGQSATLLAETTVTIGSGSGYVNQYGTSTPIGIRCRDDTAADALEKATRGDWDRSMYIQTIEGERHTYSPSSWTTYINRNYADWGVCDLRLADGDSLVFQAGLNDSNPHYRPYSPVLEWDGASATHAYAGASFAVDLIRWDVPNTADIPDPAFPPGTHWLTPASVDTAASGYTVTNGTYTATTNGSGVATLRIPTPGTYTFKASVPGSSTNWSRSLPHTVCIDTRLNPTC